MTVAPSEFPSGTPLPVVLVVDDEAELREEIAEALGDCGLPAMTAAGAGEAVERLVSNRSILVVLSDLRMPEHDGFEFVEHLRLFCAGPFAVETVLLTGHGGAAEEAHARETWLAGFLRKPARLGEMQRVLRAAAATAAARRAAARG
jgi:CheY-like chemotaxis protein